MIETISLRIRFKTRFNFLLSFFPSPFNFQIVQNSKTCLSSPPFLPLLNIWETHSQSRFQLFSFQTFRRGLSLEQKLVYLDDEIREGWSTFQDLSLSLSFSCFLSLSLSFFLLLSHSLSLFLSFSCFLTLSLSSFLQLLNIRMRASISLIYSFFQIFHFFVSTFFEALFVPQRV